MPARSTLARPVVLALALAGCGSGAAGGTVAVSVDAGDTTCGVARTSFDQPGKVAFAVSNSGKDTTEVYVYGKSGDGGFDKVVGEVENVAPGISREFTVDLAPGQYEVACKPGEKGDGIRTPVTVAGARAGASTETAYDREVEVTATDYALTGLEAFSAKAGESVEFKLENKGAGPEHEFEVFGPDGEAVGEVGPTRPGGAGEVVLGLPVPGTYTYECGIGDHVGRGMRGTFTVV